MREEEEPGGTSSNMSAADFRDFEPIDQTSVWAECYPQNQRLLPPIPQNLAYAPSLGPPQGILPYGTDAAPNGPAPLHQTAGLPGTQFMPLLFPFAPNPQTTFHSGIGPPPSGSILQQFNPRTTTLLQVQNRAIWASSMASQIGLLAPRFNSSGPPFAMQAPAVFPVSRLPGDLDDTQIAATLDLFPNHWADTASPLESPNQHSPSATNSIPELSSRASLENLPPTDVAMRILLDSANVAYAASLPQPESPASSQSSELSESVYSSEAVEPALPEALPIMEDTSPIISEDADAAVPAVEEETTESQRSFVDEILDPEDERLTQMSHIWPFTREQVVAIHFCKYAVLKVGWLASDVHVARTLQQKLKIEIRQLWVEWVRGRVTRYEFTVAVARFAEESCMPTQKFSLLSNFLPHYKLNVGREWAQTMDFNW